MDAQPKISEPSLKEILEQIINSLSSIELDNFDKEEFISGLDKLIQTLGVEENEKYLDGLAKIDNLWSQVKGKLSAGVIDIDLFYQLKTAVDSTKEQAQLAL